jgi:hypothetical protein
MAFQSGTMHRAELFDHHPRRAVHHAGFVSDKWGLVPSWATMAAAGHLRSTRAARPSRPTACFASKREFEPANHVGDCHFDEDASPHLQLCLNKVRERSRCEQNKNLSTRRALPRTPHKMIDEQGHRQRMVFFAVLSANGHHRRASPRALLSPPLMREPFGEDALAPDYPLDEVLVRLPVAHFSQ